MYRDQRLTIDEEVLFDNLNQLIEVCPDWEEDGALVSLWPVVGVHGVVTCREFHENL